MHHDLTVDQVGSRLEKAQKLAHVATPVRQYCLRGLRLFKAYLNGLLGTSPTLPYLHIYFTGHVQLDGFAHQHGGLLGFLSCLDA